MSLRSCSLLFRLEKRIHDDLKINLQKFLRPILNLTSLNGRFLCQPIADCCGFISLRSFLHLWRSSKNSLPFGNTSSLDENYRSFWASQSRIWVISRGYDSSSIYLLISIYMYRGFHIDIKLSLGMCCSCS